MTEPAFRPVMSAKNQAGHDLILGVMAIHVYVDEAVFTGDPPDMVENFRFPINPDTGLMIPFRPASQGDFMGAADMQELLVHRIDEDGKPEMGVEIRFWKPRTFEIFIDPDTLRTVVLDVTSPVGN